MFAVHGPVLFLHQELYQKHRLDCERMAAAPEWFWTAVVDCYSVETGIYAEDIVHEGMLG